jgi:diguanylate cyclase (GGDEF)-like protein
VVDHLAELTAFRDRDILDVSLAGALRDLLQPRCVAIHRTVGQPDQRRWLTRARLAQGDAVATADPLGLDLDQLPALHDFPLRHACLERQQTTAQATGLSHRTVFPLATDREVVGVLEIDTLHALDEMQQRMVCSVLRIYSNFQGLLDYSERDTLTGLLNRKTFDENFMRVAGMLPRTLAADAPVPAARRLAADAGVWLGVIDIDHFKRVNDGHGHLIGDEVLLLLARLMRSSFRFHDHLYRFGGEEFVVLMRCADDADAAGAFERLRGNVQTYPFPRVGTITVSVGFTRVRASDTPSEAFERADKAVYHSKQNGRNQVADHADLVARGVLADTLRGSDVELF